MKRPIRILMLLENNSFPEDNRVRHEAQSLAAAGYRVSVICPSDGKQPWREKYGEICVYRFPPPPEANGIIGYFVEYGYSLMATFLLSLFVFFSRGFDVLHAHNPPDIFFLVGLFYKIIGKKFVFDHHDLSPEMYQARFENRGNRLLYNLLIVLEKWTCKIADHVIATNQSYKQMEIERGNVPPDRITIVRNGPDLEFTATVQDKKRFGQDGKTVLGYVGIMGFQDGVDYLLRSLKHLVRDLDRTDFVCVLVGKGDAEKTLKSLSDELCLSEFTLFTGWVEFTKVFHYLHSFDICLAPEPSNPYTDRSTAIKMMEYMASKKPIVAFDLPEHHFTAKGSALYAQPNDELDFAKKIAWLMDHPEQGEALGQAGRDRIQTSLCWERQEKHLLQAYESLIA